MFIDLEQNLSEESLKSMLTHTIGSAAEVTRDQFLTMASELVADDIDDREQPFLAQLLSMKVSPQTKADVERQRPERMGTIAALYATMFFTLVLVSSCCTTVSTSDLFARTCGLACGFGKCLDQECSGQMRSRCRVARQSVFGAGFFLFGWIFVADFLDQ